MPNDKYIFVHSQTPTYIDIVSPSLNMQLLHSSVQPKPQYNTIYITFHYTILMLFNTILM